MSAELHVEKLVLQGDIYADGFTIHDLDLTGLGLDKTSVGLGNVDNTSDLLKPLSNATIAALALKEPTIASGNTDQLLIGDKTWLDYGALALQNGATTLPLLSVIGASSASTAVLKAKRNDSVSFVELTQLGASVFGNVLTALPGANVGMLSFDGDAFAVIKTTNSAPLVFGTNNTKRMRLGLGLSVGDDSDPGAGGIFATGTVTAAHFDGSGDGIFGLTKDQIPATLNATVMPRLSISGVGGAGYIEMAAQSAPPTPSIAKVYANSLGRVAIEGALNPYGLSFATDGLSAARIWTILDVSGTVPVVAAVPGATGSTGKPGTIAYESGKLYVCVATNTWQRVSIAAW